ncbi:MAG: hypothetical protein IJK04_00005, partial [Kiritimatiellae bacterium]|nr:hypothetical protein [Kiritimatiellia bacterium]
MAALAAARFRVLTVAVSWKILAGFLTCVAGSLLESFHVGRHAVKRSQPMSKSRTFFHSISAVLSAAAALFAAQ